MVVPRAMVSLKMYLTRSIESEYFDKIAQECWKVNKLEIEELYITLPKIAADLGAKM